MPTDLASRVSTLASRLPALGGGEAQAQGNEDAARQPAKDSGERRAAPESLAQGARGKSDGAKDRQAYERKGEPETEHLQARGTRGRVDELRQEGEEE